MNEIFNIKTEADFQAKCLETFLYQYENVEVYRKFVDFLEKTPNRLKYGEANVMEKASADLQRSQIKILKLKIIFKVLELRKFKLVLNIILQILICMKKAFTKVLSNL